jgi:hypothetical protein
MEFHDGFLWVSWLNDNLCLSFTAPNVCIFNSLQSQYFLYMNILNISKVVWCHFSFHIKSVIQRTDPDSFLEQSWLRILRLEMCHNIPVWNSVFRIHCYKIVFPECSVIHLSWEYQSLPLIRIWRICDNTIFKSVLKIWLPLLCSNTKLALLYLFCWFYFWFGVPSEYFEAHRVLHTYRLWNTTNYALSRSLTYSL